MQSNITDPCSVTEVVIWLHVYCCILLKYGPKLWSVGKALLKLPGLLLFVIRMLLKCVSNILTSGFHWEPLSHILAVTRPLELIAVTLHDACNSTICAAVSFRSGSLLKTHIQTTHSYPNSLNTDTWSVARHIKILHTRYPPASVLDIPGKRVSYVRYVHLLHTSLVFSFTGTVPVC